MALENLISVSFKQNELTDIDAALNQLAQLFAGKTINLTPEQRQQYGSIAEQNKLFVNKAKSYMEQFPQFVPPFLDKKEFDLDYDARTQIEQRMQQLNSLAEQLTDTKILLDYDNYHNALTFYRNLRYLSGENVAGTNVIFNDMKQFFAAGSPAAPTAADKETSKG